MMELMRRLRRLNDGRTDGRAVWLACVKPCSLLARSGVTRQLCRINGDARTTYASHMHLTELQILPPVGLAAKKQHILDLCPLS